MNLNLSAVVMFIAGVVLMYAAVNNKSPQDVIREAMSGTQHIGTSVGKAGAQGAIAGAKSFTATTPGVTVVTV